jgi:hypothetical protein
MRVKTMPVKKLLLLIAVAMLALAHRSDGQQARPVADQLKLSGVMPRGALSRKRASGALKKGFFLALR